MKPTLKSTAAAAFAAMLLLFGPASQALAAAQTPSGTLYDASGAAYGVVRVSSGVPHEIRLRKNESLLFLANRDNDRAFYSVSEVDASGNRASPPILLTIFTAVVSDPNGDRHEMLTGYRLLPGETLSSHMRSRGAGVTYIRVARIENGQKTTTIIKVEII